MEFLLQSIDRHEPSHHTSGWISGSFFWIRIRFADYVQTNLIWNRKINFGLTRLKHKREDTEKDQNEWLLVLMDYLKFGFF
ncbi:hypothetical protein [Leptospira mayottensis]|uniref:hypothetical protein n=1 Tax=Leptospira mayottensis TaxID=1137606 RepID=UPI000E359416|nr:hypothetical protein [Leptospira mayottensis]AXR68598.1 hypothetical protein DPV73_11835 [Leptospira mayottensis]